MKKESNPLPPTGVKRPSPPPGPPSIGDRPIMNGYNLQGIRVVSNHAVPEDTIFVNPKVFLLLTDPEKWEKNEREATQDMVDKVNSIFKNNLEES